jgi:hypothetical protein
VYKWDYKVIGELYYDNIDFEGIVYWYEDAKQYVKEINKL